MALEEGWAFPTTTARKPHYFRERQSLCGRYGYWGPFYEADQNAPVSESDCKACRTKLGAETSDLADALEAIFKASVRRYEQTLELAEAQRVEMDLDRERWEQQVLLDRENNDG